MVVDQETPKVAPGLSVGISISESEDLSRFGVSETHIRMALGELARGVLIANGGLVYGGHLQADGYTAFLLQEIWRSGKRNRPFTGYVPFPVHRAMATTEIVDRIEELSVLGTYKFLDAEGASIDPLGSRPAEPDPVDEETAESALTAARIVMTGAVDGRISLGGQRSGHFGRMPGVAEETLLMIQNEKPIYVAGGFGGVAGDLAVALGIDTENWLGLEPHKEGYLDEFMQAVAETGWELERNGLSRAENQRLAITYRASEVASLVVLGLSRLGGML